MYARLLYYYLLKLTGSEQRADELVAERLLQTDFLEERVNYLGKNGFEAYGAVVTGPVKELLKIREYNFVRNVQLGEIKPWNWDE